MAAPFQDCVILIGDSLTQRMDSPGSFAQRMTEAYSRKLDILNRGFGGYNSSWILPLLPHIFARKGDRAPVVRLVTIWLGTNDSVLPSGAQHVPLPLFRQNLHTILTAITAPSSPFAIADTPVNIALITPAPCLPSQFNERQRGNRSLERTGEFREAVLDIAKEWRERERSWRIASVDVWGEMVKIAGGTGQELAPMFIDGLHFSSQGYEVLWNKFVQVLKTEFSGRGLDFDDQNDLPLRSPWSGDVDPMRPESVVEGMRLPDCRQ